MWIRFNLAKPKRFTHERQGLPDQAETFYQRPLAACEKVSAPEQLNLVEMLCNLADFNYRLRKNYSKAELLYKRALAIGQKKLGEADPPAVFILNNRAALYGDMQRPDQAVTLQKQVETFSATTADCFFEFAL